MSHKFQIDLSGIIELLSKHLYSSPQVYIRELLQNGVDAISARNALDSKHEGAILIRLSHDAEKVPCLIIEDNGIGLTEEEIHRFLATIGQSSKRGVDKIKGDFIGQFGIGLLSCFVVSSEIVVKTRSAKSEGQTIEWRGRDDGTYMVSFPDEEMNVGTQALLRCKPGSELYFSAEIVKKNVQYYGSLLPFPIRFEANGETIVVNEELPPWKRKYSSEQMEREAFMDYGRRLFNTNFFDYIRLESQIGGVEGAAYVLPFSPSLASKKTHRVYLKNMLLSEDAEGLLPDWAFFVKSVVNVSKLKPTASRESFYEDETLVATRAALGTSLRAYLIDLAKNDQRRLSKLISLHYNSIKALAIDDEEFFRLFIDWLPFETSSGWVALGEYKKRHSVIRYVPNRDQFRQMAKVATAQSISLINSSYVHDTELLYKHSEIFPSIPIEVMTVDSLTHSFSFLSLDEQEQIANFLLNADAVLRDYQCTAEVRRFSPADLPVLYLAGNDAMFRRSIEQTKEAADSLWAGVLENFSTPFADADFAQLCFNYANPLVAKIARLEDKDLQEITIKTLYVQSLMLSHRPLSTQEMRLLNEGLLGLLNRSVDSFEGGWIQ
jgi:molecular chaperone HtpG